MSFHLCPMQPEVLRLFQKAPEKFYRRRIPIAERARTAAQNRSIGTDEAQKATGERFFKLGTNSFMVVNLDQAASRQLQSLLLSYLGSAFDHHRIAIVAKKDDDGLPLINVSAVPDRGSSAPSAENTNPFTARFKLELKVHAAEDRLHLHEIESKDGGLGGKALAAVYNIARGLDLSRITFTVDPRNTNARQFYFHLDFGRPVPNDYYAWVVFCGGKGYQA